MTSETTDRLRVLCNRLIDEWRDTYALYIAPLPTNPVELRDVLRRRRCADELAVVVRASALSVEPPKETGKVSFYRDGDGYTVARELAEADRWLDVQGAPTTSSQGEVYSLVGRIIQLLVSANSVEQIRRPSPEQVEALLSAFDTLYQYASDEGCHNFEHHRYSRPNRAKATLVLWLAALSVEHGS